MIDCKNFKYLENAALNSSNDVYLWCRYLNKFITFSENKISKDLYNRLLGSDLLSDIQKRILRESMDINSLTHFKICSMSSKRHGAAIMLENINTDNNINSKITDDAFELLNKELSQNNLYLEIICAGGYVLQTLGIRSTMDVDAFFTTSQQINSIIEIVGDELDINSDDELWLNNSISNMNKKPTEKFYSLYKSYSNLDVYMVSPEYLIGMKLNSGREKDFDDIALLINKIGVIDPIDMHKKLLNMNFNYDFDDLLSCFGNALGHKWLANYYKDHSTELLDYL